MEDLLRSSITLICMQYGGGEHGFTIFNIKGIFSDSNKIFLWYEPKDINKKSLFPKFQLIPILRFQIMHDYVCFDAPIGYYVE